jgi:hypothetical protein
VDARLHQLQGKAGVVTDLLALLQEFYADVLTSLLRHQRAAQVVTQYDANNTYQYIINRQDAHLAWVGKAIEELGGAVPEVADPSRSIAGKGDAAMHAVFEEDVRDAQAFVDRWRPRVDAMTNARHAKMLQVVLGEVLEQKRFFQQALAGRKDLLGRRAEEIIGPAIGEVLPTRWIE